MSALPQVASLSVSFDPYVRQGWHLCPIPSGTKGPKNVGWNQKENTITDPNMIPSGYGVGLCHAYSGTMALDIDVWDRAAKELADHGIDLQALYDAPDAVTIISGNPGHGKLLYAMPFGLSLTGKKLIYTTPEGIKQNYLDFRCATASGLTVQDVLPPTIHPMTCQPYTWGGNGNWQRLPTIPMPLLSLWQTLLEEDTERTINVSGSVNASWDEIKQALDYIDPSIARDDWVQIGMALHYAGTATDQLDQALVVFDEWSAGSSTKYKGQRDILTCWKSFKADQTGIKLGTLFHYATQAGWTRPIPDVSYMFKGVDPLAPKSIIQDMVIHPPVVNLDMFPAILTSRAKVLAKEFAADPLVPIMAGLAVASSVADKRHRLRLMADWKVPPVLWTMTIGSPSAKKTSAAEPMYRILRTLEEEDLPRYKQELQKFEALDAAYASSKKAYLQAAQDPNHLLGGQLDIANLPPVTVQPSRPARLRLQANDVTSQKILRMAEDRPRGVSLILDEMKGWFSRITNPQSGDDRSTWVEGYNCRSKHLDRVGDGKSEGYSFIEHFALSIHGNAQPNVLKHHFEKLTEDGCLQRFIFAVINDEYSDVLNDPTAFDSISQLQYEEAIRRIYNQPVTEYKLSEKAYIIFREFQEWYIRLKKDERLISASDPYIESLSKIEGTAGRLILIYHLLTDPTAIEVEEKTTAHALALVMEYIIPAMRYVHGEIEGIENGSLDKWILNHIVYVIAQQQTITLREIKRSAKRQLADIPHHRQDAVVLDAMAVLERSGWATLLEQNGKTTRWALNPVIEGLDKDHRLETIKARQRINDMIHKTSGGRIPRRIAAGYDPVTMD